MVDLNGTGFNKDYPEFPNVNLHSPYASIIMGGGIPIHNDIDVNGTAGEVVTNVFSFDAEFELKKLWIVITDATEITTASGVYFDIWDGATSVPITADGLDLSGATVHAVAVKDGLVAAALTLLDADQVRYDESAFNKAFVGGIVGHKTSTTCYLRLRVDTDANTDITVRVFMNYIPLDFLLDIAAV